jgi:hypothetical protein
MDILTKILLELAQFGFIFSIIFITIILIDFIVKVIGRFRYGKDTVLVLTLCEKILILLSVTYFFTYLI